MKWLILTCALALAACSSDSRTVKEGSALLNFGDSGCKRDQGEALTAGPGVSRHALLTTEAAPYSGLTCFSWDATGATLKIDCLNFGGGCSIKWQGDAVAAGGNTVTLYASHEPEDLGGTIGTACANATCGSCIYDWSYEVKGIDAAKDSPLTLIEGGSCASRIETYTASLPLATKKKGALCRYTDYGLLVWGLQNSGTLHNPCGITAEEQTHISPCVEGLVCTKMGVQYSQDVDICLKPCSADADCPLDGLLKCDAGLCKLKETW